MNEIDGILDERDDDAAVRALDALLRRPVREVRMGEARSPEQDLIAAARRRGLTGARGAALARVGRTLLGGVERLIAGGDLSEATLGVAGRLGFLCTSLDLEVDAAHFYAIALALDLLIDAGASVPLTDHFLVLRSVGRLQRTGASNLGLEVFWTSKLDHDAFEMRTLAAQNLVRVASPSRLRTLYAESLFATDVDHQLVAFEWLLRAGSPAALAEEVRALSPVARGFLARGLDDVGEGGAALAVRSLVAADRPDAAGRAAAPDWLGDLPSGRPVPALVLAEFPRVAADGTTIAGRLRPPRSDGPDVETLRSYMRGVGARTGRAATPTSAGLDAEPAAMAGL